MDKESKSGFAGLPNSGVMAVLVLAAGALFLHESPLEGTRPAANEPRIEQHFDVQDVDARLWQDPLGAIARAREERARKQKPDEIAADDGRHSPDKLATAIRKRIEQNEKIVVLGVMLGGGPYAENVESRRRIRYAVLAGLNASRFAPFDTEHLGYVLPQRDPRAGARDLPHTVPFEWFEPAPSERAVAMPLVPDTRRVLVLWLDGGAFSTQPFARLKVLADLLEAPDRRPAGHKSALSWRVLGPVGSDGLKSMLEEAKTLPREPFGALDLRVYSLGATVPDRVLLAGLNQPASDLSTFFGAHGIDLVRSIGDDSHLANALVDELERRGLKAKSLPGKVEAPDASPYADWCWNRERPPEAPSTVAVVAEWDTLYGRNFRREFMPSYGKEKGFCVEAFSYVRGLDGQLPDRAGSASDQSKPSVPDKAATEKRADGTFIERAEGQGQFDYLRRVAAQMRARDAELRRLGGKDAGIRAIGVLGNDVHDKLLVLQALQPEFPNAVFFTTDLDARFFHPREQPWTRNLIVASNFGLRLVDGLQRETPPFRDGYQTSAFFSTRLALDSDAGPPSRTRLATWLARPRLFEIGRTGAFDFSPSGDATAHPGSTPPPFDPALVATNGPIDILPRAGSPAQNPEQACWRPGWSQACADIHPLASAPYPMAPPATRFAIFGLLTLLLWVPVVALSPVVRDRLNRFVLRGKRAAGRARRWSLVVGSLLCLQIVLPLMLSAGWEPFARWLTLNDKPLTLTEGISLWPTEAIRLLTLLLSAYLIARAWTSLALSVDKITVDYGLVKGRHRLILEQRATDRRLAWWQALGNMFAMRFTDDRQERSAGVRGLTPGTVNFWKRHIVQNRLKSRAARTAACVLLMTAVTWMLVAALGQPEFVPLRGPHSRDINGVLGLCTLVSMYALLFFVVDATVFCVSFVRYLRLHDHTWPQVTLDIFTQRLDIPPELLDHWIDLDFIRVRTRCVSQLVYYPFIVLSLALLSRNAAFDDWNMTLGAGAAMALCVLIMLGCAWALRHMAEKSRRLATKAVDDALMRAQGEHFRPTDRPLVAQLERLRKRIAELDEGAFAPYSQQPLLRAVLLPFAALGGSTLLDYMALANI